MARNRMTWGAGRSASAPPATPGYNREDQDHPAHQPDPAYEAYKKGDPSAWAEDPRKGPYPQGNPPALPGYDDEDQDHPAHKEQPRVPKEARSLRAAVERKAQKCIFIAGRMLGKKASREAVEEQALDMMDWADSRITATLERLGGGFLAEQNPVANFDMYDDSFEAPGFEDDFDMVNEDDDLDLLLAAEEEEEVPPVAKTAEIEGLVAQVKALSDKIESLRLAGQNDPNGPTLAPSAKSEDQARKEAKKADDDEDEDDKPESEDDDAEEEVKEETAARKTARKLFASYDTDRDGFVMEADWTGDKALFAALDTDKDGILAEEEVVDQLAPEEKKASEDTFTAEERQMLASMTANVLKSAKKAEDEVEVEEKVEEKPASKKAKKAEDDEEVEEVEEKPASKKACGDDAGVFGMVDDPMNLADEDVLDDDDALLAEIFGKSASDEEEVEEEVEVEEASKKASDEEEEVEEVEEEDTAAKKKAMRLASQRPQPRKPSKGARTVGAVRIASENEDELSRLWQSAPDVSQVFGMNKD